ncbi:hypothetical protein EUZ87_10420 [Lactiplantibacillus paraplantarum]|uniref:Uncharacterized protein n=1 Tax=Lactiplantibacillus paraplantarum TaxID=60520 RepID=A0A4Q9Y4K5_9LACO|nr:hypothetical protein EUZ87_10420 [Lactiplantibacillus paraplantarum]
MKKTELYSSYKSFIKNNYPTTFLAKPDEHSNDAAQLYICIYKIIFQLKLMRNKYGIENERKHYIQEIEQLFLKVLLVLPLNDKYLLDTLLRSISESELRLILTASSNRRISKFEIEKASFSTIKKQINLDSYLFKRKKQFIYLYDLFSTSSVKLHGPLTDIDTILYLNEQLRTSLNYGTYKKKIFNILKINLNIFQNEMPLKYADYGIEELTILKNIFSHSEQIKLDYY